MAFRKDSVVMFDYWFLALLRELPTEFEWIYQLVRTITQ